LLYVFQLGSRNEFESKIIIDVFADPF